LNIFVQMDDKAYEQALIRARGSDLRRLGGCQYCIVIDWKDEPTDILRQVQRWLPSDYLRFHKIGEDAIKVDTDHSSGVINASKDFLHEAFLASVNELLLPKYEMRIFRPTSLGSSSLSLLLRPVDWWADLEKCHRRRVRYLFVRPSERVQEITSRTGSWWSKMFGAFVGRG
jgi:hypothetical protein